MSSQFWNPWHGCRRISEGCKNCYMFRLDEMRGNETTIHKNKSSFRLPVQKNRAGNYKFPAGTDFSTCFTSDFFLEEADEWRKEAWEIIRSRPDCTFEFFTKRIFRAGEIVPPDWGQGYENVFISVSIENQRRADERAQALIDFPCARRGLICAPLLEEIHIEKYLSSGKIAFVSAGGEAYNGARPCDYRWILSLRAQCMAHGVPFTFHQTGENFIKDGKRFAIPSHRLQLSQARKAGIDYSPETSNT